MKDLMLKHTLIKIFQSNYFIVNINQTYSNSTRSPPQSFPCAPILASSFRLWIFFLSNTSQLHLYYPLQCRWGASLQSRFYSEDLQLNCFFPVSDTDPPWYFQGWQKWQILHTQEEGPAHPLWAPEHFNKVIWPFTSLALKLQHEWVDSGSI